MFPNWRKNMAVKKSTTTRIETTLSGIEFVFDSEYSDTIFVDQGTVELEFDELMDFMREVNQFKLSQEVRPTDE